MMKSFTCVICPNGCRLEVEVENDSIISVSGNLCPRGEEYAKEEVSDPKRTIASSVLVDGGEMEIVSVRLDRPVSKSLIFPIMDVIRAIRVSAPVHIGDVIVHDILSTGADLIATRNVEAMSSFESETDL